MHCLQYNTIIYATNNTYAIVITPLTSVSQMEECEAKV